ncbi:Type I restriction modification DNA specificity domain [Clostridium neonatale]|uniref:restriction endonuclease subunit S n=1 Tax=Clostridium neonatale TaxID=137838 RepID=UPI00291BEE00|nr:restriction endonuclease subunit S [Clostridium neonatale]CAI3677403.1 Type I restriction modification DNA specificity domain [Clostridium neonatale]
MKVKENCILKSGFQGKTSEGGDYKIIKLKDVSKDGIINYDELESFGADKVNEKYFLKKGDIILKAKSGDNTAALITEDIKNVVAAAHFIVITIKDINVITPEYLTAYLNSEYAQDYFKQNAEGTTLPIIKLKTLEDLEVKVIDMEKQKKASDLYRLIKEEKKTMELVMENRANQFKAYLREMIEG